MPEEGASAEGGSHTSDSYDGKSEEISEVHSQADSMATTTAEDQSSNKGEDTSKEGTKSIDGNKTESLRQDQGVGEQDNNTQSDISEGTWCLEGGQGPLKDAHVNVKWAGYYDDTVENLNEQYQAQIWAWANFMGENYKMWVSRLEAMKVAKVPITNIVTLGLGRLHLTRAIHTRSSILGRAYSWPWS